MPFLFCLAFLIAQYSMGETRCVRSPPLPAPPSRRCAYARGQCVGVRRAAWAREEGNRFALLPPHVFSGASRASAFPRFFPILQCIARRFFSPRLYVWASTPLCLVAEGEKKTECRSRLGHFEWSSHTSTSPHLSRRPCLAPVAPIHSSFSLCFMADGEDPGNSRSTGAHRRTRLYTGRHARACLYRQTTPGKGRGFSELATTGFAVP